MLPSTRELPREPEPQEWTDELVQQHERRVFARARPLRSDLLFVFGSPQGEWDRVLRLYERGYAPRILVTGLGAPNTSGLSEAEQICEGLVRGGVPRASVLTECRAMNTLENVRFGAETIGLAGLRVHSILFFAHAHHSGRAWRTLARWLPGVQLSCATHDGQYDGTWVRRADWMAHEVSRRRVHGEYLRIQRYAARGDCLP